MISSPRLLSALGALLCFSLLGTTSCSRKDKSLKNPPNSEASPGSPPIEPPKEAAPAPLHLRARSEGPVEIIAGPELVQRIKASGAKATLVNAWASWCGPCRREFPMLVSVAESLSASQVDLVFVSVDEPSKTGPAVDFAQSRGVEAPIFVAKRPLGEFKEAMSPKWPGMLPATFLFDADGKLRYFWPGEVFESELVPIVEGFLAGKDIDGYARVGLQKGIEHHE